MGSFLLCLGVIALTVDVEGSRGWFNVGFVNVIFKVHGDVKKVNFCLVWFYSSLQAQFVENVLYLLFCAFYLSFS